MPRGARGRAGAPSGVRRTLAALAAFALTLVPLAEPAAADAVSGRTSSDATAAVFVYREARTDVIAPTVELGVITPRDVEVRGRFTADVITSASVSVDAVSSASIPSGSSGTTTFSETRNEGELGVAVPVANGARPTVVRLRGRASVEPDYRSGAVFADAVVALEERATLLTIRASYAHDEVREAIHDPTDPSVVLRVVSPDPQSDFESVTAALEVSRITTARLVLGLGYELGWLSGYLGSPYRRVSVDGRVGPEDLPRSRVRHTASVVASLALPRAHASLRAELRLYADDWSLRAATLDLCHLQSLSSAFLLRLRARLYAQSAASFDSGADVVTPVYYDAPRYTTANPRYGAFRSLELGLQLTTRLDFRDPASRRPAVPEIDVGFDYRLAENRYGHAANARIVLRVPLH